MIPLISIIVPLYNSEKYIDKCIDSILEQTFSDFELLLINDGSTDNSIEICNRYYKKDSRVKVFNKENGGVSSARNLGLRNASGNYITFVDSDDWVRPEFLEKLYNAINPDTDFSMCGYIFVSIDKMTDVKTNIPISLLDREQIINTIINSWGKKTNLNGLNMACTKLYRKGFIADIRFDENQRYGEDWWFNIRLYDKAQRIAVVEDCLYYYSDSNNANSLSKAFPMDYISHFISSYEKILPLVYKYNLSKNVFTTNYIRTIIRYTSSAMLKLSNDDFDFLYKQLKNNKTFSKMVGEPNNLKKNELRFIKSIKSKTTLCFWIKYDFFMGKVRNKISSIIKSA